MTSSVPARHVFVCWANNSGSTLVETILSEADNVANLPSEGQFVAGFEEVGPVPMRLGAALLFTEVGDVLADATAYDWRVIERLWSEQWNEQGADAMVRLEKSTPNVCRLPLLCETFERAGAVIGWRDPYAQCEGILRARRGKNPGRVARHALECLRWQQRNLEWARTHDVPHVALSYEELTADPSRFCEQVRATFGIHAVLPAELRVKTYTGPVEDLNDAQIARLDAAELDELSSVFATDTELLAAFGYEVR